MGFLFFTPWKSQTSSKQQERNKKQGQNRQRVKMGQESRWVSVISPWNSQNGTKVIMSCCCLPPDRVKLIVNSRVKMGCCCLPPDRVKLTVNSKKDTNSRVKKGKESRLLLFTPWKSQTNSEQQEKNKQQGQNRPRVKMSFCYLPPWKSQNGAKVIMGCCSLPPDRVKLAVNSKKKQTAGSKLAKSQNGPRVIMGFCYLTPWKSQNEANIIMGCCCLPPDRVKLAVNSKKETNSRIKMGKESKWAKGQDGLLFFTPWQSQTSSEQQERNKQQGQNGQRVKTSVIYPLKESN